MGVYPESFMAPMRDDVGRLLTRLENVTPAGDSRATPGNPAAAAAAQSHAASAAGKSHGAEEAH
jgi:NADH-quinone oxidoreductase subunit M